MKSNIKIIIIMLFIILTLIGILVFNNNSFNSNSDITADELYNTIKSLVELPEMSERSSDDLELRYGITIDGLSSYKYMYNNTSYYVDTIAIFKTENTNKLNTIKSSLETILTHTQTSMKNYDAEQYKIAENGEVFSNGNFVFLIISPHKNEIKNIINDNL